MSRPILTDLEPPTNSWFTVLAKFLRDHQKSLALIFILLLGLGLRLYRLDWQSGWSDETFSVSVSRQPFGAITQAAIRDFVNPPLYYYLLHVWMGIAGGGMAEARLFSVLCGWLAIFVLFRLVQTLCGTRPGLFAAALLAVSQTAVAYSQEARTYSLTLLLALCTAWLFVAALKRPGFWWGFVVCGLLMIYTHYYAAFVLLACFVFSLLYRRRYPIPVRSWIGALFVWGAAYLPWLASGVLAQLRGSTKLTDDGRLAGFRWFTFFSSLNSFNNGRWNGVENSAPVWTYPVGGLLLIAPIIWWVAVEFRKRGPTELRSAQRPAMVLFGALWLVPMLAVLGLTGLTGNLYGVRYILIALAPYYALAGVAIAAIKLRWLPGLLTMAILIFSAGALRAYYLIPSKTDYRGAGQYLNRRVEPDDCIGFVSAYRSVRIPRYWTIYGSDRPDVRLFSFADADAIAPECQRLWVVWDRGRLLWTRSIETLKARPGTGGQREPTSEQLKHELESLLTLSESKSFYQISVDLWYRKAKSSDPADPAR